jgi:hypothetical protein
MSRLCCPTVDNIYANRCRHYGSIHFIARHIELSVKCYNLCQRSDRVFDYSMALQEP